MPYEVIKRVGGRAYRYEVTSFRDSQTGKSKGSWRYLGRVDPKTTRPLRKRRESTRQQLMEAFEPMLRSQSFENISVEAIAARARVTRATFYRHFRSKRDLLMAIASRIPEGVTLPQMPPSGSTAGKRADVRAQLRAALSTVLHRILGNKGVVRAILDLRSRDRRVRQFWDEFMEGRRRLVAAYVRQANAAGFGYGDDPQRLCVLATTFLQAAIYEKLIRQEKPRESELLYLGDVLSRIFIREAA